MKIAILALFLGTSVAAAYANPITLTFTGLKDEEAIDTYYDGGAGGDGTTGGTNYGISFTPDSLALISGADGGMGNFDDVPPPATDTIAFFLSGAGDTMDVAGGFTTGFSFDYASNTYSGVVDVYSGLNGTGTLLSADVLSATGGGCDPNYTFSCWDANGVTFAGTAQSVVFSGTANEIGFANITLGSATAGAGAPSPTPEPSSLVLLGSGILGLAGAARRKLRR